ncbi:S8 family serine peptidase [Kitasatospora sp. NBC_01287]|uniref:S8 family serine peptidase n=1 Tax=Kitasatospora sp. NBC_01287 TaxID=2903573 RepID=UPI0022583AC2|nr:S8 family serine peptidase [Kitasatospora sp. NBC_01287]MCX4745824.1 S8 family serine peptidase [Kitasatospora sp. NBC_01287]
MRSAGAAGRRAATAALLAGGLLLPAGLARADASVPSSQSSSPSSPQSPSSSSSSSSSSSAAGDTLPGVSQLRTDQSGQQPACLPASAKSNQLTPWAQTFLRPDQVWPLSQGAGVTVAVLGSGVADGAGLLTGRVDYAAKLTGGGDPARDCVGHGSFLAGLIAADQRGDTGFAGLAPRARILAVGVADPTGATTADLLAQGIRAAADRGARVIDVGVTVPAGSDALLAAVRYAVGKGALIAAPAAADAVPQAAGASPPPPAPVYPAAYPEVLAVRDLGPGGILPQSGGAAVGGRVDLAAPGDAVMSVGPAGGGYYTGAGASFAAAFVAGSAALALGYRPELTEPQLARRLEATAYRSAGAVPDPQTGYGSVDPVAAVTAVLPDQSAAPSPAPSVTPAPSQRLVMPPVPRASAAPRQAGTVALGALAVIVVAGVGAVVVPRGRSRGWRPPAPGARREFDEDGS